MSGDFNRRAREALKGRLWKLSPRLFDRFVKPHTGQVFSIGMFQGGSPLALGDVERIRNPVLTRDHVTDVPAAFVADPFMIKRDDGWYMFMEVFNRITRRGHIGVARSEDRLTWRYDQIVLEEPFHLAYPSVFEWNGEVYMIPDAPGAGARLYRALDFPRGWVLDRVLIEERNLSDSTIFEHQGSWWLFAGWARIKGEPMSLRLYHASTPLGPWQEHQQSPVIEHDDSNARPAGRVLKLDGQLIRLAQDCVPHYGTQVRAFAIGELTRARYREREVDSGPVVQHGEQHWNRGGMHHVDAHPLANSGWIACVDGWYTPGMGPAEGTVPPADPPRRIAAGC